jgi:hypothetical protein
MSNIRRVRVSTTLGASFFFFFFFPRDHCDRHATVPYASHLLSTTTITVWHMAMALQGCLKRSKETHGATLIRSRRSACAADLRGVLPICSRRCNASSSLPCSTRFHMSALGTGVAEGDVVCLKFSRDRDIAALHRGARGTTDKRELEGNVDRPCDYGLATRSGGTLLVQRC